MIVRRLSVVIIAALLVSGCWPFRRNKPATPEPALLNTPEVLDSLWQLGEREFNKGSWNDAKKAFTRLSTGLPANDKRQTKLTFYQAEIELAQGNELDAVRIFRRIADEKPDDPLAADALLRAGDAYANLWRRPELDPTYGHAAANVYQEVGSRYAGTPIARRAESRLVELSNQFAYKEYQSALYYYRYKADISAVLVLRSLVAQYPQAEIVPTALERLVMSYQRMGWTEEVRETCLFIGQFHPNATRARRLCPAVVADSAASR